MSLKRFTLAAVLAALSLSFVTSAARAQCNCVDHLAHQLTSQIAGLEREYATSFRGARQYLHGLSDLREMSTLAAHLHDTLHGGGSGEHLRADAERLDRAFHHFETTVAEMERTARYGHWGWESQSFRALMASVGGTIHQLREMATNGCGCAVPTTYTAPASPNAGNGWTTPAYPAPSVTPTYYPSLPSSGYGSPTHATPNYTAPNYAVPNYTVPNYTVPTHATPSLPAYPGSSRQGVPRRTGAANRGIFFRL